MLALFLLCLCALFLFFFWTFCPLEFVLKLVFVQDLFWSWHLVHRHDPVDLLFLIYVSIPFFSFLPSLFLVFPFDFFFLPPFIPPLLGIRAGTVDHCLQMPSQCTKSSGNRHLSDPSDAEPRQHHRLA
jgi:hypothetical protein